MGSGVGATVGTKIPVGANEGRGRNITAGSNGVGDHSLGFEGLKGEGVKL